MLVYAKTTGATAWTGNRSGDAGVLLPAEGGREELVASILSVAEDAGVPEHVARECVSGLPPVEL